MRDKRLLSAGFLAHRAGKLPDDVYDRLQQFCAKLPEIVEEPPRPALLHGDFWSGNVLTWRSQPVGLIDPALYYGHAEMDLAFSTMFGGLGAAFVETYAVRAELRAGYRQRFAVWNLWPLLVHVYLFGGSYVAAVDQVLRRHA